MRDTDVSGPTALILSRNFQLSTGAQLVEFLFQDLPKDRVLVLTNVGMVATPGAAQNVLELVIQGVSQGVENFNILREEPRVGVAVNAAANWQGEVYIQGGGPGTDTVRIFGFFDAAANANTITIGMHGIVIPRGNLGGF